MRLATGIVNVFSRTPALIAQTIASLDVPRHIRVGQQREDRRGRLTQGSLRLSFGPDLGIYRDHPRRTGRRRRQPPRQVLPDGVVPHDLPIGARTLADLHR